MAGTLRESAGSEGAVIGWAGRAPSSGRLMAGTSPGSGLGGLVCQSDALHQWVMQTHGTAS